MLKYSCWLTNETKSGWLLYSSDKKRRRLLFCESLHFMSNNKRSLNRIIVQDADLLYGGDGPDYVALLQPSNEASRFYLKGQYFQTIITC